MLRQSRRNWVSSPMSTSLLLSLIGPVRGFDKYVEILKDLQGIKSFNAKTKVFVSTNYTLKNVSEGMQIESEKVDFNGAGAKENILKWVSKSGFKNWDPNNYIFTSTKYVLMNIATLQMPWYSTKECGTLMTVYNTFGYTEDVKYEARILELPLQNKDFKVIILVPNETDVLYSLFNKLSNEGLNSAVASIQPLFTAVSELKAPSIEFEAISEFNLEQCNCDIGAGTAIDVGDVKINESGAVIKSLTCILSENPNKQLSTKQETETCDKKKLSPFLFAINYKDYPIFTGQFTSQMK